MDAVYHVDGCGPFGIVKFLLEMGTTSIHLGGRR